MTEGRRILVVWNPSAGSKAGLPTNLASEDDLRAAMAKHGLGTELYRSESSEASRQRVEAAVSQGYDAVVAAGGDGTAHGIARLLLGSATALGLLPLGSAMNLARAVGVPRDLDAAAGIIAANHVHPIDVGVVSTRTVRELAFFEIVSIGLSAEAFERGQAIDRQHRWGALVEFVRLAARYRRTRIQVQLGPQSGAEARVLRARALALAVANGPATGMNVALASDARIDDGLLDLVVFEGVDATGLVAYLLRALAGRPPESTFHVERASDIRISTRRPLAVRADATDAGVTPVRVSVRPGALRVLSPPGSATGPDPRR